MSAISITPASVLTVAGSATESGILGATLTAGEAVYKSGADSKLYAAQNDSSAHADVYGILLTGGAAGQPCFVQRGGDIIIGGTVVIGAVYLVGASAGSIVPDADLTSGVYVSQVGIGISATTIRMQRLASGVQVPAT